jgi:hypothetical protein
MKVNDNKSDREDDKEKSQQVPMMAQIYSEAANVRIWLGKDEEDKSGIAMDFLNRIIDFENFDGLIADERMVREWAALLSLMKRTWFGVSSTYHLLHVPQTSLYSIGASPQAPKPQPSSARRKPSQMLRLHSGDHRRASGASLPLRVQCRPFIYQC